MATGLAGLFQPEHNKSPTIRNHKDYEELAAIDGLISQICEMQEHTKTQKPNGSAGSADSACRDRLQLLRQQKASLFQKLESLLDEEPEVEDASPDSLEGSHVAEKAGLYEELSQAKSRIKQLEQERVAFRRKFKDKVRKIETENTELKSKQLHLEGQEAALSNQAELLQQQKELLNKEALSLRRFAENIADDTKALNKQVTELGQEVAEARAEASALSNDLVASSKQNVELKKQLDSTASTARENLVKCESEKASLEANETALKKQIAVLEEERDASQEKAEQLSSELKRAAEIESQLSSRIEESEQKEAALEKRVKESTAEVSSLTAKIESITKESASTATLQEEKSQLQVVAQDLTAQLETLRAEKSREVEASLTAAKEAREESTTLSTDLKAAREENGRLQHALEEKEKVVDTLRHDLEETKNDVKARDVELTEARKTGAASSADYEADRGKLKGELDSLRSVVTRLEEDLKCVSAKGKEELISKEEEIKALSSKVTTQESRLLGLESELAEKREQASTVETAAKAELAEKDGEINELRTKLKKSLSKVEALESSLATSSDRKKLEQQAKEIASLTLKLENSNGILKREASAIEESFANKLDMELKRSKQLEKEVKLMKAETARTETRHENLIAKLKEAHEDFVKNLKLAHAKEKSKLKPMDAPIPQKNELRRRKTQDLAEWCKSRKGGFDSVGQVTREIREMERLLMSSKLLPEEFMHKAGTIYHQAVQRKEKPVASVFVRRRTFVLTACALLILLASFVFFYSA